MTRAVAHPILSTLSRLYFGNTSVRRLVDGAGLTRRFLRSPFFRLPRKPGRILELLGDRTGPRVHTDLPVLVQRWKAPGTTVLHLVNYSDAPVRLRLAGPPDPRVHSPDRPTPTVTAVTPAAMGDGRPDPVAYEIRLGCYAVMEWRSP